MQNTNKTNKLKKQMTGSENNLKQENAEKIISTERPHGGNTKGKVFYQTLTTLLFKCIYKEFLQMFTL